MFEAPIADTATNPRTVLFYVIWSLVKELILACPGLKVSIIG
jgi:hypothetical protein